jgi:two-component system, OmpR family, phosphate regulon sensor histidine kinase PhoR
MKRIFPIITILIFLSLLGLIFFQFLWIKSARDAKDKQVEENIIHALEIAGETLSQGKNLLYLLQTGTICFFPVTGCNILNHQ